MKSLIAGALLSIAALTPAFAQDDLQAPSRDNIIIENGSAMEASFGNSTTCTPLYGGGFAAPR